MIGLTEIDFGLLLLATLTKKGITEIKKPLIQKELYQFVKEPMYRPLLKSLYVRKDEYNEEDSYIELSRAFSYCHLNGIIIIKTNRKNESNVYNLLTEQRAENIIKMIDRKYGSDYTKLMDIMVNSSALSYITYVDSNPIKPDNVLSIKKEYV